MIVHTTECEWPKPAGIDTLRILHYSPNGMVELMASVKTVSKVIRITRGLTEADRDLRQLLDIHGLLDDEALRAQLHPFLYGDVDLSTLVIVPGRLWITKREF